jgi:hypothetical protein
MKSAAKARKLSQAVVSINLQLARHPSLVTTIYPYVLHPKRSNWDTGEPWWNPRAIRYLKEHLPPNGVAFEWGSGGSTVWLSNNGLKVTAIESEQEWANKVRQRSPSANVRFIPGTDSGKLRSEPQLRDRGKHFFDDYVAAIGEFASDSLDVIIVDGICRIECSHRAAEKVKPNGIVVVDDTNWDFLKPASEAFKGWEAITLSGFKWKSSEVFSTTFFRRPK